MRDFKDLAKPQDLAGDCMAVKDREIQSDSQPSDLGVEAEINVFKKWRMSCLCDFQVISKKQERE